MSATPNLAIEHILQSQAQKEVTANEAFDALDQAIAGLLEVDVSAGGTITVDPAAALLCKMLRLTGTLAADAEAVVPDNRKPYFVHNATAGGFGVTVRTAGGAGVIVGASPDNTAVVYCDGVDVLAISAGTAGGGGAGALIELGDTDIALRSIGVTLANPGAEAGDTSGWTTTGTWDAGTAEGTVVAPHGGSFYFSATGGTDPAILEQTVDLITQGFTAAELDAGATFDASVWAASEYQSDTGELKLQFLDAAGTDVGSAFTTGEFGPNDGTWVEQTLTGDVPVGARQVRVQLLAHNHFGSNTTYGFDDLSLSLSIRRPVTGDLLRYDGSAWVGVTAGQVLADAGLGDLGDVDASDATAGYVLTREADGSFAFHAVGGGSASTKVFDDASDGGDTYTLSPEPQGTVLVWVDGLLGTDYSVAGATLTFGTAPPNGAAIVAWDIGGGGPPYDVGVYFPGQPDAGATLLQLVTSRAFTLPADLTDSQGYAGTAPTAQADLDIRKNGASIGTITFAAAASTATFSFASEVALAAGDRLTIFAPGSQDASLADISITFKGTRS